MSMKIAKINVSVATPIRGLITKKSPKRMPSTDKTPMPQPPPCRDHAGVAAERGNVVDEACAGFEGCRGGA